MSDITLVEGNNQLNVQLTSIPPPGANLYGVVTDAQTGSPIPSVRIVWNGRMTYTDAMGRYSITIPEARRIAMAFSHVDYDAYWTEITLVTGDNTLNVALTPAVTGEIALSEGYNLVTYTGRSQTVGEAFASIADYIARVYRVVDTEPYEDICSYTGCLTSTKMMIPGETYWVAVYQGCIWTF